MQKRLASTSRALFGENSARLDIEKGFPGENEIPLHHLSEPAGGTC